MAVGQPFNQQYEMGDVIYGLSQARAPYVAALPEDCKTAAETCGMYLICDAFNNRTFGKVPGAADFGLEFPNSEANIKANVAHHKQDTMRQLNPAQKMQTQQYYSQLADSKYAPLKAMKVSEKKLTRQGNRDAEDLAFRRACKFGLKYFIETKQCTVHFVLDLPANGGQPAGRISSIDVVQKQVVGGHVPITTSELRSCFRNRDSWISSGRLKFYFRATEVRPPWDTDPAAWAAYRLERIQAGKETLEHGTDSVHPPPSSPAG